MWKVSFLCVCVRVFGLQVRIQVNGSRGGGGGYETYTSIYRVHTCMQVYTVLHVFATKWLARAALRTERNQMRYAGERVGGVAHVEGKTKKWNHRFRFTKKKTTLGFWALKKKGGWGVLYCFDVQPVENWSYTMHTSSSCYCAMAFAKLNSI